jgi:hypothetical protein
VRFYPERWMRLDSTGIVPKKSIFHRSFASPAPRGV